MEEVPEEAVGRVDRDIQNQKGNWHNNIFKFQRSSRTRVALCGEAHDQTSAHGKPLTPCRSARALA